MECGLRAVTQAGTVDASEGDGWVRTSSGLVSLARARRPCFRFGFGFGGRGRGGRGQGPASLGTEPRRRR